MTVGIRARFVTKAFVIANTMSNVTEEQRSREEIPNPHKGARRNKSRDALTIIEARVTRLEVAMTDVKEMLKTWKTLLRDLIPR